MTFTEIQVAIAKYKPLTPATIYGHLRALKIKPLGVRQIPQNYPEDTADRVLIRLGIKQSSNGRTRRTHSCRVRRQLQKEAA